MKLSDDQIETIARLCRQFGISRLQMFGSAATQQDRPESDVDLLIEFDTKQTPTGFELVDLQEAFQNVYGGRRVDLAFPSILTNPYRRRSIEPQLTTIYR